MLSQKALWRLQSVLSSDTVSYTHLIKAINKELEAYNPQLLKKPQVIAANKIDAIAGDENEVISALRAEFEPQGIKVFPVCLLYTS